ncbi:hypothetical protein FH603_3127 [Spirosoma sp. LMG 31447]|uniref:Uncharacterized protein n=1 Tax=Spirosoma utsteinense TaxID=2585773 RepID=A0ABR6W8X0_9BACT|nr:hypothetical protein [Spirosoma utsteinense]
MKRSLVSSQGIRVLIASLVLMWACDRDIQLQTD